MFPLRSPGPPNRLQAGMNEILFTLGDLPIHVSDALIGFGALALVLLLAIAIIIGRSGRRGG